MGVLVFVFDQGVYLFVCLAELLNVFRVVSVLFAEGFSGSLVWGNALGGVEACGGFREEGAAAREREQDEEC